MWDVLRVGNCDRPQRSAVTSHCQKPDSSVVITKFAITLLRSWVKVAAIAYPRYNQLYRDKQINPILICNNLFMAVRHSGWTRRFTPTD